MMSGEKKRAEHSWVLFFVLAATLIFWVGQATAEESSDLTLFNGTWTFLEQGLDCNGQISDISQVTIESNDQKAELTLIPDTEPVGCLLIGSSLQCSGEISLADGGTLKLLWASFYRSADNNLIGNSSWIRYDAQNKSCIGFSSYTPVPSNLYFDGNWNFVEIINGCGMTDYTDEHTAVITQTGNTATLCANNSCFDCNVTPDTGLTCGGEFTLEDGSVMEYKNANLQYSGEDSLEGEADFEISSDGVFQCDGTSQMSATRISSR